MFKLQDLVVNRGDADAIVFFDGDNETRLSYGELHRLADSMASELRRTIGHSTEKSTTVIGIHVETSELVSVCILGILKASCCFVYLSPSESQEYLNRIVERAGVELVISDRSSKALSVFPSAKPLDFRIHSSFGLLGFSGRSIGVGASSPLAYIMFTSGTTGDSKMVRVPHSCIVPNILHLWNEFETSSTDIIFLSSPLTFDPSIIDIFLALSSGSTLLMVSDEMKLQPRKLAKVLFDQYRVSVLQTTPTLLLRFPSSILKEALRSSSGDGHLRILALGGEPFPCSALAPYFCYDDLDGHRPRLYNMYGPTEVSCWSTCHRVTPADIRSNSVPIGEPMLGTRMVLRKDNRDISNESDVVGELCIGGKARFCFVDEEHSSNYGLRQTGDLAIRRIDDRGIGRYYLIGRRDDQTKRMGKRLNLVRISQVIERNVNVKRCAVILEQADTLRAFVQLHDDNAPESTASIIAELRRAMLVMPIHCQPDWFRVVDALPMTKHGKIDRKALLASIATDLPSFHPELIENFVKDILKTHIRVDHVDFGDTTTIKELGIDSFNAVAIISTLEQWTGRKLPKALEILLFGTVGSLVQYVQLGNESDIIRTTPKTLIRPPSSILMKRTASVDSPQLRIVEKCGRVRFTGLFDGTMKKRKELFEGRFVSKWKWDSRKCVDASPVFVEDLSTGISHIYIGSHSGRFACLDSRTGVPIWIQRLNGRIEATASVTACGKYVVVGCYDGSVNFFDRLTGAEWWRFQTGDVVKCTACTEELGIVYIGSHDHYLYKLDYEAKQSIWSVNLTSAILSSPVLASSGSNVFSATLQGVVYCLSRDDGIEIWNRRLSKPVFASLILSNDQCVLVACVDGTVNWISTSDGSLIRQLIADSPIFSTPSLFRENASNTRLIFGCQSGSIYCVRDSDASVRWTRKLDSSIVSSPFPFDKRDGSALICVVTSLGAMSLIRIDDGAEIGDRFQFGNEVFSSPVVWDGRIYVGCRNDFVYCLEIE